MGVSHQRQIGSYFAHGKAQAWVVALQIGSDFRTETWCFAPTSNRKLFCAWESAVMVLSHVDFRIENMSVWLVVFQIGSDFRTENECRAPTSNRKLFCAWESISVCADIK